MIGSRTLRAVVCAAACLLTVTACGDEDRTEDAAVEACVEAAGGEATESTFDGDVVTVEGADGNVAWSCVAVYEDGAWQADTRAGTEPALPPGS